MDKPDTSQMTDSQRARHYQNLRNRKMERVIRKIRGSIVKLPIEQKPVDNKVVINPPTPDSPGGNAYNQYGH